MPISSRGLGLPLLLLACVLAAGGGGAQGLVDGAPTQPPRPELLPVEKPVADLGGDAPHGDRQSPGGPAGGLLAWVPLRSGVPLQLVYPLARQA